MYTLQGECPDGGGWVWRGAGQAGGGGGAVPQRRRPPQGSPPASHAHGPAPPLLSTHNMSTHNTRTHTHLHTHPHTTDAGAVSMLSRIVRLFLLCALPRLSIGV
eukprot:63315-Rhodomonas_salina.3